MVVPPEALAEPGACAGFLYLDIVHPASAAWAPVAMAAADAIGDEEVDRVITLGDSFSDVGSLNDTFLRTLGFSFPPPPFSEGRFTEAENVVQQLEALLATEVQTIAFAQPLVTSETFIATGMSSVAGTVFVPKAVSGDGYGVVAIRFNAGTAALVRCLYWGWGSGEFALVSCGDSGPVGGDRISSEQTEVRPFGPVGPVTIDWLAYEV